MKNPSRPLLTTLILAFCGWMGWWVARDLKSDSAVGVAADKAMQPGPRPQAIAAPHSVRSERDAFRDGTTVEIFASKQDDEVILRFPSVESYGEFLFTLVGSKIELVDQIDRFRAVRLRFDDRDDLYFLLIGENITAYDALPVVTPPAPVLADSQPGRVGFGNGLLPWLGITGDNSRWGEGVRIAVLDTGIVPHPALPGLAASTEIVPFQNDLAKTRSHGTAVASLIAGNDARARGVAPAAELVSVRVSDDSGMADSFALAKGIVAAIEAGAHIINISMGCAVDNPLIEEGVLFARDQGVLIVASSGNSELEEAAFPAAYPSVISVGSVDARGEHLDFSNFGTYLSLTAPGYAINAALPGGRFGRISGTSASAPIVAGAIAATMSNGFGLTMSATDAAKIVMDFSDEAGMPGADSEYGVGILNVGRIMMRNQLGIVDAAITDQRIAGNGSIEITVQNRGTSVLVNTQLDTSSPLGTRRFNITSLAPGDCRTFSLPVRLDGVPRGAPIEVNSTVTLGSPGTDVTPYNNQRGDTLYRW